MKKYFIKEEINNFNIGVITELKNKKLEIISGIELSSFTFLLAKPLNKSVEDFLSFTLYNANYTYAVLGVYHMNANMLPPLTVLINKASDDWLSGEYEDCYPGPHYCEFGSAHLLGVRNLSDNTFLFFSVDFFVTAPPSDCILGDPGFLQEYLVSQKIRTLNHGDFSNNSGHTFLDKLRTDKYGVYFSELILNDNKIKEIEKTKESLEKAVKPSYNKIKLENKI